MSRTSWWRGLRALAVCVGVIGLAGCSSGADRSESAGDERGAQGTGEIAEPAAGASALAAAVSTDANLKIAFTGDTADGSNWDKVAKLAKSEGAQAIMVAGDMTYTDNPESWWSKTETSLSSQTFPVFLARGNHDDGTWSRFLPEAATHLGGAVRTAGPHNAAYKTVFKGLTLVNIRKGDSNTTVNNLFSGDTATWKVCGWHQNQNKMQVGGKGDEMGWPVYEACKAKGAIIITGHEHSYHRTKTMTNTQTQTVDSSCSSGNSLCVGPNRTFVAVVGTGGTGLRSQMRCKPTAGSPPYASLNTSDPSCKIWASIYTTNQSANYGVLFITFNVDGNPKNARAYFKNIAGATIDTFDIFAD